MSLVRYFIHEKDSDNYSESFLHVVVFTYDRVPP